MRSAENINRLSCVASIDSFTSTVFPWRTIPQRPRQMVASNQTGREVNPTGFFLCMASVMLLTTGIGICAASLWAITYAIPYTYLTNSAVPLGNYALTFCAGMLSIPCCWIACTSHDSRKNYTFLPLLILLIAFSMIMLAISVSMGLIYKSQMKSTNTSDLLDKNYQTTLNKALFISMFKFDTDHRQQAAWNKLQQKLKCCGSFTSDDWLKVRHEIPPSCCQDLICSKGNLFTNGCLNRIAIDVLWQVNFISGSSVIVFAAQMFTICIACYMYIKGKLETQDSSTSINFFPVR